MLDFLKRLVATNLSLFDGAAAGEGGNGGNAADGTSDASAQKGEPTVEEVFGITRQTKKSGSKYDNVVFGKTESAPANTESNKADAPAAEQEESPADREKAYRELMDGKFKDLYTKDTQRIIDKRFKAAKENEAKLASHQPIMDMLAQKYGIEDGDPAKLLEALDNDNTYWERVAEDRGLTVEQAKHLDKVERENKRLNEERQRSIDEEIRNSRVQKWSEDAEAMKASGKYPAFDLDHELEDEAFVAMLKNGVPLENAYRSLHLNEIIDAAVNEAVKNAQKSVVDNIRAKGARPSEAGTAANAGMTVKVDPSKFSGEDIEEVFKRVANGERISFG